MAKVAAKPSIIASTAEAITSSNIQIRMKFLSLGGFRFRAFLSPAAGNASRWAIGARTMKKILGKHNAIRRKSAYP
jgi:hypothetical protein